LNTLHGSHFWMVYFPDWFLIFVMLFMGYGVLFLLRDYFEGFYYNISFAAVIGDIGLMSIVMIGAGILKSQGMVSADWVRSVYCHFTCAIAAIGAGAFLLARVRRQQGWFGEYADRFHNIVIVPAFSYLVATLLPIIYYQGSSIEKGATVFFIALWATLVYVDSKTDKKGLNRLDQQTYLQARKVPLQSSRSPWSL
jgi:hypothetical protein